MPGGRAPAERVAQEAAQNERTDSKDHQDIGEATDVNSETKG